MMDLAELKQDRRLVGKIDWDITPQQAFETHQLKSVGNWRGGADDEVIYFYVSTWKDENRVLLMRRTLKHSEEIAEAAAPAELVERCVREQEGSYIPRGQCPIDEPIRRWLQEQLGV